MSATEVSIYYTKESDVAKGRESLKEMVGKTRTISVPVIEIDSEIMLGFDQAKLREKLGL